MVKNYLLRHKLFSVSFILFCFILLGSWAAFTITLPGNAKTVCTVTPAVFNSWFASGAVSLNGVVKPANSVTFPNIPNCSFYQWSEQMYLWLTSPTPPSYGGGGGRIFASPAFYLVSPPDANGERTLISNKIDKFVNLDLRSAQLGKNKLPVIMELKTMRMFEIVPTLQSREGKDLILNSKGQEVEVGDIIMKKNEFVFLDRFGKRIINPKPIISKKFKNELVVQKFRTKLGQIFLSFAGKVIKTEPGQAGIGEVLMAQNGSLVYYFTTVNQVYAYFLTGAKNLDPLISNPNQFPTTAAQLNGIVTYAANHGKTIVDPDALAIEVKTSWIEASTLPNPNQFITMKAEVPKYDKTNPLEWVRNGSQIITLAMVGMHVVGSTNGHPEMIWATFEHIENTPSVSYQYINSSNATTTNTQNTSGAWLFCATGSTGPFNQAKMFYDFTSNSIKSTTTNPIGPSNTRREFPFGLNPNSAAQNTEVISINNSIRGMLAAGDVRANYIMTGSTWTAGGAFPNSSNQKGTNILANSTMETYQVGSNCFSCHGTNNVDVSHIYWPTKKLF